MADLKLPSINRLQISGRITKDIELKHTGGGTAVVSFSLANDRSYKDKDGQWQKETCFVNIVAWGSLAESVEKNARKGSALLIDGRLTSRSYQTTDNQKREVWEVVAEQIHFLEWKQKLASTGDAPSGDAPF